MLVTVRFEDELEMSISKNYGHKLQFEVLQTGDGSGKGAALITAIAQRLKRKRQGLPPLKVPRPLEKPVSEIKLERSPDDIFKDTLPFTEGFNGELHEGEIFITTTRL